jgi:hypothetical protein
VANKAGQDIDLEDTLQTLSDVLQQLQQLEADTQSSEVLPVIESPETKPEVLETATDESVKMAEETAVVTTAMINNSAPLAVTVPEPELPETADGFELSKLFSDSKKPTTSQTQESRGANQAINVNADDSGLEFDRSISAMLGRDDATANQQDKSASTFKSDTLVNKLTTDAPKGVDSGQFLKLENFGDFKQGEIGDLVIQIELIEKDGFEKMNNDLIYNLFLDLEGIKDDKLKVPHPDGDLMLGQPKIFDTSKPLRLKGKGYNGGDMYVKLNVRFESS